MGLLGDLTGMVTCSSCGHVMISAKYNLTCCQRKLCVDCLQEWYKTKKDTGKCKYCDKANGEYKMVY